MNFEIYCDESSPDLFTSKKKPKDQYLLIGSIWIPAEKRAVVKQRIKELKNKHKVGGQIKWQKVSNSRLDFYREIIDLFVSFGNEMRFRCIAVKASEVDFSLYHKNDAELGFYKFYYQLIHHWILDFNCYSIFCDTKTNRNPNRLAILKQCLERSNLTSKVTLIQSLPSKESVLIQLTDFLLGAVGSELNKTLVCSTAKQETLRYLKQKLNRRELLPTPKSEEKFNIFEIRLQGGW